MRLVRTFVVLGLMAALFQPSAAPAAGRPDDARAMRLERSRRFTPPTPRMDPVLSAGALARLRSEGRAALWVVFTDKGIRDERAFEAAVRSAGERLSDASRTRRAREQGGTYAPDYDDIPVPESYVAGVRETGAALRHVSRWLNAASVRADERQARAIASLPYVRAVLPLRPTRRVEPVSTGAPESAPAAEDAGREGSNDSGGAPRDPAQRSGALTKPSYPTGYGSSITQLTGINAIAAHDSGWSGANVIVSMFDTGYDKSHNATIQLKRIAERDFINSDGETANEAGEDVASQWSHGTGTWAVAGGYYINNLVGPAYNATFALAKTEYVPSETGVEEDNWVAAAEWSDSLGAEVISSSLAYLDFDGTAEDYTWNDLDGYTTVVAQGAMTAARRGILIANAMGNEGPLGRTLWSPADAESILSCGAVDNANNIATFSSRGNTADGRIKPEVVAQGVSTYWAVAGSPTAISPANGTSLSTPLVGGAVALVREAHPEWTVAQVREALMTTADKAGTPDSVYGWGRINVNVAIYSSIHGPPVYPKPFDLLVPPMNGTVSATPVTFRWRRSVDPTPGDAVSYDVTVRRLSPSQVIFSTTTSDTFATVTGYLGPSTTYEWTVVATDLSAHARASRQPFRFTTGATTDVAIPPSATRAVLHQNRPNPFLRATDIPFTLEGTGAAEHVELRIFDPRGRLVRTLFDGPALTAREYTIRWDGREENGTRAAAGIYFYRMRAAGREQMRRLVLLR